MTRHPLARHLSRRAALGLLAGAGLAAAAPMPARAAEDPVFTGWFGIAIRGYDPVAYHLEGGPVKGVAEFETAWNGATWRFASAENLERFLADPARWAPAYGGYCAWAVSQGYTASTDPDVWDVVDGRLYLNYSAKVQERWHADVPGHITSADANWPGLVE